MGNYLWPTTQTPQNSMEQRLEGRDAFRCDQATPTVFAQVGREKFVALSTAFYGRVYASENEGMRNMFVGNTPDINDAIQNQYEVPLHLFFIFVLLFHLLTLHLLRQTSLFSPSPSLPLNFCERVRNSVFKNLRPHTFTSFTSSFHLPSPPKERPTFFLSSLQAA